MHLARVIDEHNETIIAAMLPDGRLMRVVDDPETGLPTPSDQTVTPQQWLPPIMPAAILCIGKNYADHATEFGGGVPDEPIVFMKNPSATTAHQEPIHIPAVCDDEVDYEGELAVIIGETCRNVSPDEALNYVMGYTIANDVTARKWQKERGGTQWVRGKSFDSFCPLGPVVATREDIRDPQALHIRTLLNGEEVQSGPTSNMMFDVRTLISFLSQDTTLLPGTVILTGTPEGIGWARDPKLTLKPGDEVRVEIEGIGALVNPVAPALR